MKQNKLLPYISDEDLYRHTTKVVEVVQSRMAQSDSKLYSNVVDPFSSVFGRIIQGASLNQWLNLEKARQIQKTLENCLGDFHQNILSSMPGWERIPDVVDLRNYELMVIAEVKNKFNTTKGSDKKGVYDNLNSILGRKGYEDFNGYYVEVIPSKPLPYNRPFTPPDNVTRTRRTRNDRIRIIDGYSFYELASGCKGALKMLYEALPKVISDIVGKGGQV